ncbi:MAG: hypothetical protein JHD16_02060 [Solirubrobacteraceae bacterium]|nr:hypothetical protein [Solirubrobacteraceae bacterium]
MVVPIVHTRPHRAALLAVAATALMVAAPASAATLGLDQRCYVSGEQASVSGSGFTPRATITMNRGTDPVTGAIADNSGAVRGTLLVPEVAFGLEESQVEVTATDGTNSARAFLNIAKVGATFTPKTGDLRTLRVAHVISGFGLAEAKPSIYLHYVSPAAQKVTKPASTKVPRTGGGTTTVLVDAPGIKTIRLGQLRGPCGVLRTSPRRLFPFKVTPGKWRLQYDTRPLYTRGATNSTFLWAAETVIIDK